MHKIKKKKKNVFVSTFASQCIVRTSFELSRDSITKLNYVSHYVNTRRYNYVSTREDFNFRGSIEPREHLVTPTPIRI